MKKTILSAKGLCKSFAHNGGQIHVLSNVDLELFFEHYNVSPFLKMQFIKKTLFPPI